MDGTTLALVGAVAFVVGTILTFSSTKSGGGEYRPISSRLVISAVVGIFMAVFAMLLWISFNF